MAPQFSHLLPYCITKDLFYKHQHRIYPESIPDLDRPLLAIKYGGPILSIPSTAAIALIAVFTRTIILAALLSWRSPQPTQIKLSIKKIGAIALTRNASPKLPHRFHTRSHQQAATQ